MRWERNSNSGTEGVENSTAQNRPDENKLLNTGTTILHPTELQHSSSTSSDPTTTSSGYNSNSYGHTRTESIQNKDEVDSTNLVTSILGDITSHDYNISYGHKDRTSHDRSSVDIHPNSGPLNIRQAVNTENRIHLSKRFLDFFSGGYYLKSVHVFSNVLHFMTHTMG